MLRESRGLRSSVRIINLIDLSISEMIISIGISENSVGIRAIRWTPAVRIDVSTLVLNFLILVAMHVDFGDGILLPNNLAIIRFGRLLWLLLGCIAYRVYQCNQEQEAGIVKIAIISFVPTNKI